jgi:hypothetical protein
MSEGKVPTLKFNDSQASEPQSKTYGGIRTGSTVSVTVNGCALNPRLDLWNHSPSGFEWGYGGSGPAQLALAILADHLGDGELAVELHQEFKFQVVARLQRERWTLASGEIDQAIRGPKTRALERRALSLNDQPEGKE